MVMSIASGTALARSWLEATDPSDIASLYASLHREGPLVPVVWGALLVPGYDDVRRALADSSLAMLDSGWRDRHGQAWRSSSCTVALCQTLLLQNPPEHTRSRRPLASAISARAVLSQAPLIEELVEAEVARFAARLRAGHTADIAAELCAGIPAVVLSRLAGLPDGEAPRIARLTHRISRAGEILRPQEELADCDIAADELLAFFGQALGRPPEGFLARWSGEPAEDLRLRLFALLGAGLVTSTALLANLALVLLTQPLDRARLRADPDCREHLIEETLRWDPPVKVATRRAVTATEVAGTVIGEGQVVHLLIGAAHQDPVAIPRPRDFDPGRPCDRNFAFGSGIHFCPGSALARAQATAFVPAFLRHLGQARAVGRPERQTGPSFTDITSLRVAVPRPKRAGGAAS